MRLNAKLLASLFGLTWLAACSSGPETRPVAVEDLIPLPRYIPSEVTMDAGRVLQALDQATAPITIPVGDQMMTFSVAQARAAARVVVACRVDRRIYLSARETLQRAAQDGSMVRITPGPGGPGR